MDELGESHQIPEATVARLPVYLRALLKFQEANEATVSSSGLAKATGVNAAKVRKDLSFLGSYGIRGVGYDVEFLVYQVSARLGLNRAWRTAIVGAGNLGTALANFQGFSDRGFNVVALFDSDPSKHGTTIGSQLVWPMDEIPRRVRDLDVEIGVITVPPEAAQDVADAFVDGGVAGLLNFAPTILNVPAGVVVRKVDLSIELQILAFYVGRESGFLDEALAALPGFDEAAAASE